MGFTMTMEVGSHSYLEHGQSAHSMHTKDTSVSWRQDTRATLRPNQKLCCANFSGTWLESTLRQPACDNACPHAASLKSSKYVPGLCLGPCGSLYAPRIRAKPPTRRAGGQWRHYCAWPRPRRIPNQNWSSPWPSCPRPYVYASGRLHPSGESTVSRTDERFPSTTARLAGLKSPGQRHSTLLDCWSSSEPHLLEMGKDLALLLVKGGARTLQATMVALVQDTPFGHLRWHAWRRMGATALARLHLSIMEIMAWGRWGSVTVARRYISRWADADWEDLEIPVPQLVQKSL